MKVASAKTASAMFLLFGTAILPNARAQTPPLLRFVDSGFEREFEIALDELAVRDAEGRRNIRVVSGAMNVEAVSRAARMLRAQTGRSVELILYEVGAGRNEYTRRFLTDQVLAELEPWAVAQSLADAVGAKTDGRLDYAPDYAVFRASNAADALSLVEALRRQRGIKSAQPLLAKQRRKKWAPNDTLYYMQWHLNNTGRAGSVAGIDVRVTNVWNTYRGSNIYIAIVDDGLQVTHTDLWENVNTLIDYDWNDGTPYDPSPDTSADFHGTSCAGVAGARGNNGRGVSGAAPYATLVGLRLIAGSVGDAEEAAAMAHSNSLIHIKSNSWGPNDNGQTLEGPGTLTRAALSNGCYGGRGGRGVIYTWAAGNGLADDDNANYDGYANSMYTIAIAALTDQGIQSSYSEPGACVVVTAPSSGGSNDIVTTDLMGTAGYNNRDELPDLADVNYTKNFGGTSSATPLAAGVIALLLEANPNLGWRDVQEILIRSARQVSPGDGDWKTNSAGFRFNHKYGAGLINAQAAVALATNSWTNLGPRTYWAASNTSVTAIPDNRTSGVVRTFNVTTNIRVEHVLVTVNIRHTSRGQLEVELTSPSGMKSRLAEKHTDPGDDYPNWTFSSVRHWGESAQGTWSVRVADRTAGTIGTQRMVRLEIYGTSLGALSNQPPTLSPIGSKSGTVSNLLQFTVTASDPADGDAVRLWATNLPAWATFPTITNIAAVTNVFSGTPNTSGTFLVYFFAADKDGTNSETVTINISGGGGSGGGSNLDLSGWTLVQSNNTMYYTFPTGTVVAPSGYVVLARAATRTQFESFWGITLGTNVVFLTSTNKFPSINGGETYHLLNGSSALADGPTPTSLDPLNRSVQRWSAISNATDPASWQVVGAASATPGNGGSGNGTAGLVISEYSDAIGTGAYSNEFIELYFDAPAGAPAQTPPVLNPIGDTSIQVSNLLEFAVTANPTDGDPVTLSVSNAPAGAVFSSTNENGVFSFTPNASQVGVYTTTFYATDNDGVDFETIRITVAPLPAPGPSNVVVYYDFDNGSAFEATPDYVAGHLSAGSITTKDGDYASYSGNPVNAVGDTGWTGQVNYFQFDVIIATNYALNVGGLRFDDRRSSTGPTAWRIRCSYDGFAVDYANGATHSSFMTNEASFNLSSLMGEVSFRIYGDYASSPAGTWRVDNLRLLGEVVALGNDDTDSDGLPDSWEIEHFGGLGYSASDDPDNDGQNNGEEFVGGTQPTNIASVFEIKDIAFSDGAEIWFDSFTGRIYHVLYATNLLSGSSWNLLGSSVSGTNGTMTVTDTNDAMQRFYRVRVTMP